MASATTQAPKKNGFFNNLANPILRKMEKNGDFKSSACATYGGIVAKTVFFLIVTIAGVFLCLLIHQLLMNGAESAGNVIHTIDSKNSIYDFSLSPAEVPIVIAILAISIIVPFLAWFIRKTIPVTGTIYCVSQGFLIGYITIALSQQYKFISLLAMLITLGLVASMLFIYAKKIITVTQRFRGIIAGMFLGIVVAGILFFILNLIPAVRNSALFGGIAGALNNPAVSIIISVVFVIIACLFMLVDFDTIDRCVQNKMDKSFEWMAAWGLAYTILYIYFKVLRILIMILGNRGSSK